MFSGLEGASHRIKNPKSRLGFLAAACADRLCSGTDFLDKTLWMEGRLHVFTPVRMALVLDGPGLPWGLFLRRRHPVDGIGDFEHRAALCRR